MILSFAFCTLLMEAEQAKKKTITTTTTSVKKTPPKKSTVKPGTGSQRKPATYKTSIAKPSPAAKGSKKTGSKKIAPARRTPARMSQITPTADRYKDIQSALAERGYLKSEPNGQWGPESQEALKKFQQEQNLKATGKLDSLSLISLGLGPKRTATALPRPQPTDGPTNDNRSTEGSQRP